MNRELTLTHRHRDPLRFVWNPETGDLSGPGAQHLRWLVNHYRDGLPLTPTGPVLTLSDPLRTAGELAALLAVEEYQLPDDLAVLASSLISRHDLSVPEGAIA